MPDTPDTPTPTARELGAALGERIDGLEEGQSALAAGQEALDDALIGLQDAQGKLEARVTVVEAALDGRPPPVGSPPVNVVPPKILGDPVVGQTLTADVGKWEGDEPIEFAAVWIWGGPNGGTHRSMEYLVPTKALGAKIQLLVNATNTGGEATVTSAPVGPVRAKVPPQPKPSERVMPPPPEVDRRVNASMSPAAILAACNGAKRGVGWEDSADYGALKLPARAGIAYVGLADNPPHFNGAGTSGPWLTGPASDVHVQNIRLSRWSTGKQEGAIHPRNEIGGGPSHGWKLIGVTLEDVGGRGITLPGNESLIQLCRCVRAGGNQAYGGSISPGLHVLWNIAIDTYAARDIHHDKGIELKGTAGRNNQNIPVARGVVIRGNWSSGGIGTHIWVDWDARGSETHDEKDPNFFVIELNYGERGSNGMILIEAARAITVRRNMAVDNVSRFFDKWVQAMNADYGNQNAPLTLWQDNYSIDTRGWWGHITQQNRSDNSPQGGMIGHFQSRDVVYDGNRLWRPKQGHLLTTMYVDTPAAMQTDRSVRGFPEHLKVLCNSQATQCRTVPPGFPYPEGSPYNDGRGSALDTDAFALVLPHNAAALNNKELGTQLNIGSPPTWDELCAQHGYPKP